MLGGVRLVIYDLDGTLVDSTEAIVETFNRVIGELGGDACPPGRIEEMIGLPLTEMFSRVLPPEKHGDLKACWDRYVEIYAGVGPSKTRVLPGVEETLRRFKDAGIMQSVATTKRGDVAASLIASLGLRGYFDLILGIDDVPHPKPAPDIIELTLRRLGVEPGEAILVDDTTIGLEAGKSAGVHIVGVTTGTHDRERLMTLGPDYVIDRLDELLGIISP